MDILDCESDSQKLKHKKWIRKAFSQWWCPHDPRALLKKAYNIIEKIVFYTIIAITNHNYLLTY